MALRMWRFCQHTNPKKAQALLELSVLGSIFLMLLGLLINYGLRYNYQQQLIQQTFRKALFHSARTQQPGQPQSISHMVIKDVHIPNPADPFAVGSVMPITASASVTRSYDLGKTATTQEGLPEMEIEIFGKPDKFKASYKTAGFDQYPSDLSSGGLTEDQVKKYIEIYGASNVKDVSKVCVKWEEEDPLEPDDPEYRKDPVCEEYRKVISVLDTCGGQIIDYDAARTRCWLITNKAACQKKCEDDNWADAKAKAECANICSQDIETPWYCSKLDGLFHVVLGRPRNMGLREDYTEEQRTNNSLNKQEEASKIKTTDNLDWQVNTKRFIEHVEVGDKSGNTAVDQVTSTVSQNATIKEETGW